MAVQTERELMYLSKPNLITKYQGWELATGQNQTHRSILDRSTKLTLVHGIREMQQKALDEEQKKKPVDGMISVDVVREIAMKYARAHDLCGVVHEALTEMGIPGGTGKIGRLKVGVPLRMGRADEPGVDLVSGFLQNSIMSKQVDVDPGARTITISVAFDSDIAMEHVTEDYFEAISLDWNEEDA